MTFAVGGVDVAAVSVGATPAQAVYLGSEKVWPTRTGPSLRDLILAHNPLHYWPCDEASGDLIDLGTGGVNLSAQGAVLYGQSVGGSVVGVAQADATGRFGGATWSPPPAATILGFGYDAPGSSGNQSPIISSYPSDSTKRWAINRSTTGIRWDTFLWTAHGQQDVENFNVPSLVGRPWSYGFTVEDGGEWISYVDGLGRSPTHKHGAKWCANPAPQMWLISRMDSDAACLAVSSHQVIIPRALAAGEIAALHAQFLKDAQ